MPIIKQFDFLIKWTISNFSDTKFEWKYKIFHFILGLLPQLPDYVLLDWLKSDDMHLEEINGSFNPADGLTK